MPKELRGLTLQAWLHDRTADLYREISDDVIALADGGNKIIKALYKLDQSIAKELFDDFQSLLDTKQGDTESLKNLESRLSAQTSRYMAHIEYVNIPECKKALLLLVDDRVSDAHRVPILSVDSSKAPASTISINQTANDDLIKLVEYKSISSVIQQCDMNHYGSSVPHTESSLEDDRALSSHSVQTLPSWRGNQKNMVSSTNQSRDNRTIPSNCY